MRNGRAKQSSVRVIHGHDPLPQAARDAEQSTGGKHCGTFVEIDTRRSSSPGLTRFVNDEFRTVDVQRSADHRHSGEGEAGRAVDDDVGIASRYVIRVLDNQIDGRIGAPTDGLLHIPDRGCIHGDV